MNGFRRLVEAQVLTIDGDICGTLLLSLGKWRQPQIGL